MVNYICPNCNKDFKQRSNYISHTESKKKPCVKTAIIIPKPSKEQILSNLISPITEDKNKIKYICKQCNYTSDRKDNYNRHIDTCRRTVSLKEDKNRYKKLLGENILLKEENNKLLESVNKYSSIMDNVIKRDKSIKIVRDEIDVKYDNNIVQLLVKQEDTINILVNDNKKLVENSNKFNNIIDSFMSKRYIKNKLLTLNDVVIISRSEDD